MDASVAVRALTAYACFGLAFAIAYVVIQLEKSASIGLRMILLPGAFALWPLLLLRWKVPSNDTTASPRA